MKVASKDYLIKDGVINFVAKGTLGDFIHQMYAVKNICKMAGVKANLYIEGTFKFGVGKAYHDLYDIVIAQDYINDFSLFVFGVNCDYIDLDEEWRGYAYGHCPDGIYTYCWSELMANQFKFYIPTDGNQWINSTGFNKDTDGKILINYGGSNPEFNKILDEVIVANPGNVMFITCDTDEYLYSTFKDKVGVYYFRTINDLAACLNSCKMYIGYQSAPFAVACALDINRMVVLRDKTHRGFYADEVKYSKNISYFLSDTDFDSNNSIIEI